MNRLSLQDMVAWLEQLRSASESIGVDFVELRQGEEYVPTAYADFDTETRSGRISAWAYGLIDFEVLSLESGKHVYFEHVEAESLGDAQVRLAVEQFFAAMLA